MQMLRRQAANGASESVVAGWSPVAVTAGRTRTSVAKLACREALGHGYGTLSAQVTASNRSPSPLLIGVFRVIGVPRVDTSRSKHSDGRHEPSTKRRHAGDPDVLREVDVDLFAETPIPEDGRGDVIGLVGGRRGVLADCGVSRPMENEQVLRRREGVELTAHSFDRKDRVDVRVRDEHRERHAAQR